MCGHSGSRSEPQLCFLSPDTCTCSPLPSSGFRGRSFRKPCGSPPSSVLRGRKTTHPSVSGRLRSPLASALPLSRAEVASSPGFMGNPFGSMPRARDSGDPGATLHSGRPDAAFRLVNGVGVTTCRISELNLHGLLPRCVRFAPTSRPVNGNTHYRPACLLWPGGTCTRWIPLRSFTVSSSVPPLPRFSQRDNNVGHVKSFFCFFLKFFVTFFLFRAHNCVHSEEWSCSFGSPPHRRPRLAHNLSVGFSPT